MRTFLSIVAAIAISILAGCKTAHTSAAAPMQRPAVPVTVAKVTQRTIPIEIRTIGNVEAYSTISVKAQVGGYLTHVHFTEGDFVKKGQLLFEIDKRPYIEQVRQAEGNLAKDAANLANAEADARRYAQLFKEGVVARQETDLKDATAKALQASLAADKAAVENANLQVEYCSIYSPIDGRTGNLLVTEGNLVKAQADTGLVTINQVNPIYVTFAVPESEFPAIYERMTSGLAVEATPNGDNRGPARGKLTFADNSVDPATGTIKLKGTFGNADHRLWPGQFVNVILTVRSQQNAILVPSQAVQTSQKGQYVFVVNQQQTVEMRPVVISREVGSSIAIQSGLAPGEVVVTDGQSRLTPGAHVQIATSPVEAGGAGS